MLDNDKKKLLYTACCDNDYTTFEENLIISESDCPLDDQGNTALHIATLHGHSDIIQLLLRNHVSQTITNNEGKIAELMTSDDAIKKIFQISIQAPLTSGDSHFIVDKFEVKPIQWIDSYTYLDACRISCENHEHMRRWITNVPLEKLLQEIDNGYVDKLNFPIEKHKATVKEHLQYASEENDPLPLVMIYVDMTSFSTYLNYDLAKLGSDFCLLSARSDYPDNEAPKGLGQFIYASLLINHSVFRPYQHASTTYRGMTITAQDLEAYTLNKIIMHRSFLSTSKNREVAELYLGFRDVINHPPVICIYKVSNAQSSLCLESLSRFPEEKEVLIVPFIAFEITAVREITIKREGIEYLLREIELVECEPNST